MPSLLRHAHYRLLPLPIVASDPAEKETYGVMPVTIALDENENLVSVMAAAGTFNKITKFGGFGIWLMTPSPNEELRLFGGASQRFYREASLDYMNRRWINGRLKMQGHFLYIEDPFERFYGFGPATPKSAASNFTSLLFKGSGEVSYEFLPHLSSVGQFEWARFHLQSRAIDSLPDTTAVYGTLPEVAPSNQIVYRAGLRWDSRDDSTFPTHGLYASASGIVSHEVTGAKTVFGGYDLTGKFAWQPHPRFTTIGHLRWQQLFGHRIPFSQQSSLGGENELRGYVMRRFTDHHAVLLECEERILVKQWQIMGTSVGFGVAPFFNVGQVFPRLADIRPRHFEPAGGIGFRMRAPPATLGRVDFSYSRDGLAIYTALDYPF